MWETKRPQADNSRSLIDRQVSCYYLMHGKQSKVRDTPIEEPHCCQSFFLWSYCWYWVVLLWKYECSVKKIEKKYSQVWHTSCLWALWSFDIFTGPFSQIKLQLPSTVLLSGFQSSPAAYTEWDIFSSKFFENQKAVSLCHHDGFRCPHAQ